MANQVNDYYKSIVLKLKELYSAEESRSMADRLVEHFLHLSPAQRVISANSPSDAGIFLLIDEAVDKLLRNIPLQYVLGTAFFMNLELIVTPAVLIPRPETEELVTLILAQYSGNSKTQKLNILDIGTGSGCIPIALKLNLPESDVSAIDISEEALTIAKLNAVNNNAVVHFIETDIFDKTQWNELPQFDLIVSNPPYVTYNEKKQMHRNVLDHEPHTALFVSDDDPLIFYREILDLAKINLSHAGSLWFEINERFCYELKDMALNQGFKEVNIIFDFRGKSRFLQCLKKSLNHTN